MKPIKLIIEGINSFTDAQELDFVAAGRSNLFCICGKTGAGKSTIFDSILLALYGRTGRGNLGEVVNLSRKSGKVVFEFEEGGEVYCVEREIKRTDKNVEGKTGSTKVIVYKNGEPCAEQIRDIVGLDESEFKNVYLLEQGQYAEFLKKSSREQNEIVGKIFSLMRFGEVSKLASERQRTLEAEIATTQKSLEILGDVSDAKVRSLRDSLKSLRAKNTAVQKDLEVKRAEIAELEKARDVYISAIEKANAVKKQEEQLIEAKKRFSDAEATLGKFLEENTDDGKAELDEKRARLNELSALGALDNEYAQAVVTAEQKRKAAVAALFKHDEVQQKSDALDSIVSEHRIAFDKAIEMFDENIKMLKNIPDDVRAAVGLLNTDDTDKRIAALSEVIHQLKTQKSRFDEKTAELNKQEAALNSAVAKSGECLKKMEMYAAQIVESEEIKKQAESAVESAAAELAHAQLCSHAAAVQAELHNGDTCPVCGGVYGGGALDVGDIDKLKAAHAAAVIELKKIEAERAELDKFKTAASGEYARLENDINNYKTEITATRDVIAATGVEPEIYAALSRALGTAQKSGSAYTESGAKFSSLKAELAAVAAENAAAENAAAEAERIAADKKAQLGDNCGKTAEAIKQLKDELTALEKAIAEKDKRKAELKAECEGARASVATVEHSLESARRDCPYDMPQFDEEGYREKRGVLDELMNSYIERDKEIAVGDAELKELTVRNESAKEIAADIAQKQKRADRYGTIAHLTRANAMLNFVATEYIEDFTAIASEILGELSGGKYSMNYDKNNGFVVVDYLNEAKARRTATLSGGEMFLASLSVAIAIARAQVKGDNGFFFLDEGFGTLDDELIDTVYSALESLSKDCLVGVISHSGALIDRMPSRVEVIEASDTTGSIIKI